ncbi:hypothetical protein [Pseudomonas sp. B21-053]|uniref:hypothetical protein n=1 Tax=Pseudomonas sp. B21-053 TaxID=2895493 RepID=UPI00223161AF|nr:hypothetical protein [Pseudomonas sp. B21-053]UZE14809.1 hypothetical protein LOY68_14760 [Pseudomonas sp. B21-053]
MQSNQNYMLTIHNLFTATDGDICGAEAEVAILEAGVEIDRLTLSGKVGPGGPGYTRIYNGKPGLKADLVSGPGSLTFAEVDFPVSSEA